MTDRPPADANEEGQNGAPQSGDRTEDGQVLVLVEHKRNRELLADSLSSDYDVRIGSGSSAIDPETTDLVVLDEVALDHQRTGIAAAREAIRPAILPCLLLARRDVGRISPDVWAVVDDVVSTPIDSQILAARVDSLVELRRRSVAAAQRRRIEEVASVLAHDLRNPIEVAVSNVERARVADADVDERLDGIETALERMTTLLDDVLTLAEQGSTPPEPTAVPLDQIARRAWRSTPTGDASLVVDVPPGTVILADESRVRELFANLYRNAVEHGSTSRSGSSEDAPEGHSSTPQDVGNDDSGDTGRTTNPETGDATTTVVVGPTEEGFFVADDGPGLPRTDRSVFESGYSTTDDGTGLGLSIVERIADGHGWTVTAGMASDGGARFDVAGVSVVDSDTQSTGPASSSAESRRDGSKPR